MAVTTTQGRLTVAAPDGPGRADKPAAPVALAETLAEAVDAAPVPAERLAPALAWYEDWSDHVNTASPLAALPIATRRGVAQRLAIAALVADLALDWALRAGLAESADAVRAGRGVHLALNAFARAVAETGRKRPVA